MNAFKTFTASPEFKTAVRAITERTVFTGARFGIAVYDAVEGCPLYQINAHEIFPAASTTKVPTSAYALALLGRDFRFHTRIVRRGSLDKAGPLQGGRSFAAS